MGNLSPVPAFPAQPTHDIKAALGSVPTGSAVSVIAKRMLDLFVSGNIEPGTRLPPERELASSLGIGRSAVREALAALEILGIVDVRPGSGTYMRSEVSELLPEALNWGLILGAPRTLELIAVRGHLEVMAARLAAHQITVAQLAELEKYLDVMSENFENPTKFIEADLKFHLLIAKAAGNQVLSGLLQSIRSLLRVWVERGLGAREDATLAYVEHRAVYEALSTRDADAAERAMSGHMSTAGERLARTVPPDATSSNRPGRAR